MKIKKYSSSQARKDLPFRKKNENKSHGGKCLVIAGSTGMWGAGVLCATAAARCGAGYVYLLTEGKRFPVERYPDFLQINNSAGIKETSFQAMALGPGLSDKTKLKKRIQQCLKDKKENVILDASALSVLRKSSSRLPASWILTPHEGELATMLGTSATAIRANREAAVINAQKDFGGIVVLKGFGTLIADGQQVFKIGSGNSALAKAGTGDVLTGIILGFLSQGLKPLTAACLGSYVHGAMADQWVKEKNDHLSLLASDLNHRLAKFLFQLRKK